MKIRHLTLYTEDLKGMWGFYHDLLGMEGRFDQEKILILQAGETRIQFVERFPATPYHLAFNIPPYSEDEALAWLRGRVKILADEGREIQDFRSWNARSIYFYDPDRNIVEFISRRNLEYVREPEFSASSLREVSEIGLAVDNILPYFETLNKNTGLELFDGDMNQFCAIGAEHGLIICVDKESKGWYPTGDQAFPSDFEMDFSTAGEAYHMSYQGGRLLINQGHGA